MDGARDSRPETKGSFPGHRPLPLPPADLHAVALTAINGALSEDLRAAALTFDCG